MAEFQKIDFGAGPDTASGDDFYTGGSKLNSNFDILDQLFTSVNGNRFGLRKNPGNTSAEPETGDAIINGFWDANEFWKLAIFQGGDKNTKTNWDIIESV